MPRSHEQKQFFRNTVIDESRKMFGDTVCRMCGRAMCPNSLSAHHLVPLNSGGENDPINNAVLVGVGECHIALHDKYTGKLTHLGQMLLEGFRRNSRQRSYGIKPRCKN